MKYYRLVEDMARYNKWYLTEVSNISHEEQWNFTMKPFYSIDKELLLSIKIDGEQTDFTENLTYDIPIISHKLREILHPYGISTSKVNIQNKNVIEDYYAIGVDIIDCVDEDKSKYIKYEKDDLARPDKAGDYKVFNKMVLNLNKINGKHIFRIKGYLVYLVVSEEIKSIIENNNVVGCLFDEIDVFSS